MYNPDRTRIGAPYGRVYARLSRAAFRKVSGLSGGLGVAVGAYQLGGDIAALGVDAQVTDADYVVGILGEYGVNGGLRVAGKAVLSEAVNILAVVVLEVDGGGLGVGVGGGEADVGDLCITIEEELVGLEHELVVGEGDEVGAHIAAFSSCSASLKMRSRPWSNS